MRTSEAGLALIMRFEGFSALPYMCPAGYATVGFGHVVLPHERFERPLSETEGKTLLASDVRVAERAVMRFISPIISQGAFDALVSLTFNIGAAALQRSTLRRVIARGDEQATHAQWMRWVHAGGRVLPGLERRRKAELSLYFSGY